jgi:hypothetical protein
MQFTKGNTIGSATRFGPDWQGKRCGARAKGGDPCQRPAVARTGRCPNHGGKSTGPRTKDGIARIVAAKTKHGRLTKQKRLEAKAQAKVGRQVRTELREIERWALDLGLLDRDWRERFKP